MSYNTEPTTQVARKRHQCTWCYEQILPGEKYVRWVTFDDAAFTSKMHPECEESANAGNEGYEWEYTPGDGTRPAVGEFGRVA